MNPWEIKLGAVLWWSQESTTLLNMEADVHGTGRSHWSRPKAGSGVARNSPQHLHILLAGPGCAAPTGPALHLLVSTENSRNVTVPILAARRELHPDQLESGDYSQILLWGELHRERKMKEKQHSLWKLSGSINQLHVWFPVICLALAPGCVSALVSWGCQGWQCLVGTSSQALMVGKGMQTWNLPSKHPSFFYEMANPKSNEFVQSEYQSH